jgi:hypothetical protein
MKSSQPLKLEIVADQLFSALEAPVIVAYLDQLNRMGGTKRNESDKLTETLRRLNKAVADYKEFVAASSATRNAIEGLHGTE